jgi:hypothetical protein
MRRRRVTRHKPGDEQEKEERGGSLRLRLDRGEISLYAGRPIRRKRMGKKKSARSVRNDGVGEVSEMTVSAKLAR